MTSLLLLLHIRDQTLIVFGFFFFKDSLFFWVPVKSTLTAVAIQRTELIIFVRLAKSPLKSLGTLQV